jgi:hypothetical protein
MRPPITSTWAIGAKADAGGNPPSPEPCLGDDASFDDPHFRGEKDCVSALVAGVT